MKLNPVRELLQADEGSKERMLLRYMAAASNLTRENELLRQRAEWLEARIRVLERAGP